MTMHIAVLRHWQSAFLVFYVFRSDCVGCHKCVVQPCKTLLKHFVRSEFNRYAGNATQKNTDLMVKFLTGIQNLDQQLVPKIVGLPSYSLGWQLNHTINGDAHCESFGLRSIMLDFSNP